MAHLSRVKTGSLWERGQDHASSDSESFLELFLYRPHLQWGCLQTWLRTVCSWRLLLATVQLCSADKTLLSISAQGKDLSQGLLHLLPTLGGWRWVSRWSVHHCALFAWEQMWWFSGWLVTAVVGDALEQHWTLTSLTGVGQVCSCVLICGRSAGICLFSSPYRLMKGA